MNSLMTGVAELERRQESASAQALRVLRIIDSEGW
jgi:hypothetical protein